MLIAPSILSADFARLGEAVAEAERAGADWLHLDVMDGQFVPNLTFGAPVITALRPHCGLPFDVHLMVENPERLIPDYIAAGADSITVHVEVCPHLHRTLGWVKSQGVRAGVALNPATPVEALRHVVDQLDLLMVLTVNPGFGGQSFLPEMLPKVASARSLIDSAGSQAELQIDGGVDAGNIARLADLGATVVVAGSAVYGHPRGAEAGISALRQALAQRGQSHG